MRVSSINLPVSKVTSYKSLSPATERAEKNERKIIGTGILGLSLIAAAAAGRAVLKLNNTSPALLLKNKLSSISGKYASQKDPIVRILDGDRSAEAVKRYQALKAQAKIKSFSSKYLNGFYTGKTSKEISYMSRNIDKLNRMVSRGI